MQRLFDPPRPLFPPMPRLFGKGIRGRPSLVHTPGPRHLKTGGKKQRKYLGRIALYAKAASRSLFAKAGHSDEDLPRMCYGWASLSTVNGQKVVDHEGDWIPIEALRKSAADFMSDARVGCALHMRSPNPPHEPIKVGTVTESLVIDDGLANALGATFGGRRGWLIGFRIEDADVARAVKKGMLGAFSIGGSGRRFPMA